MISSTRVFGHGLRQSGRSLALASTAAASPSRGILDMILGRSRSSLKPLQEPVEFPTPSPSPLAGTATATASQLANGVHVVSQPTGLASATVGIIVAAGARHSPVQGMPQMLARLAIQSTDSRSQIASIRALSELGSFQSNVQRDFIAYSADVLPTDSSAALGLIADSSLNGRFDGDEVNEAIASYGQEIKVVLQDDTQLMVQEALHTAAFGSDDLARHLHASSHNVQQLNDPESLRQFRDSRFTAGNIVVVGAGVEHAQLVNDAEKYFGSLPRTSQSTHIKSEYVGGESRLSSSSSDGLTHVSLGFGCGGWHSDDVVPACALAILMGGGGSFSAGGPGKGMYSRLYTRVLNGNGWVHSAVCNTSIHDDATLFSLCGSSEPQDAGKMITVLAREAAEMKRGFSEEELSRAKNQLRSALYMNLESRAILFEDLGQQMLVYGKRVAPAELAAKVDKLSSEDLTRVAQIMLDSNPSLVVLGDAQNQVPSHSFISLSLKK